MEKSKTISGAEFWSISETIAEKMGTAKTVELLKNNPELLDYIFCTYEEVPVKFLAKILDFNYFNMFEKIIINMSKNPSYAKCGFNDPLGACINSIYVELYEKYKEKHNYRDEKTLRSYIEIVEKNADIFSIESLSVMRLRRVLTIDQSMYSDETFSKINVFLDSNFHLIGSKIDNLITEDLLKLIIEMSIFVKPNQAQIIWEKLLDCCDKQKKPNTTHVGLINKYFIETYKINHGKAFLDRMLNSNESLKARIYDNSGNSTKNTDKKHKEGALYQLILKRIEDCIGAPGHKCKRRLRRNLHQIEHIYRKRYGIDDDFRLYNQKNILDDNFLFFMLGYIMTDWLFDDSDVLTAEAAGGQEDFYDYEPEESEETYDEEADDFDTDYYDLEYDEDDENNEYDEDSDDITYQDDFGNNGDDMYDGDGEFVE